MPEETTKKEVTVTTPPLPPDKPGWKTTELWATVVTFAVALLIQIGVIPTEGEGPWPNLVALGLQMAAGAGYAISRGMAKGKSGGGGFTIKLAALLCCGALCLGAPGCNGGTFQADGTIMLELNPDTEETASRPMLSVPLQLVPMSQSPAAATVAPSPPGDAAGGCPPCPPCPECPGVSGASGEICAPHGAWQSGVAGR